MIRRLLFLPLLFFAFGLAAKDTTTALEHSISKSLSTGKIKSVTVNGKDSGFYDNRRSFETPDVCADFDLTETDVREFFKMALVAPGVKRGEAGESRCLITGELILQNGEKIEWWIDRARNAYILFRNPTDNSHLHSLNFYCEKCKGGKYYKNGALAAFRPLIKSITIDQQNRESASKYVESGFKLTEAEVREFFNVAHAANSRDLYHDIPEGLVCAGCYMTGRATLQNGSEVIWRIDQARRGEMRMPASANATGNEHVFYYYCASCTSKKFGEVCDECAWGSEELN